MVYAMKEKRGLALHWKIVIGLLLGAVVGLSINAFWSGGANGTWAGMGVNDATAFLAGKDSELNTNASVMALVCRFAVRASGFVGDLFLRGLRFIAVPIVLFSLVAGVAGLGDVRKLGRMGAKTIGLFLSTSVIAATLGLLLGRFVDPGSFVSQEARDTIMASQSDVAASKVASAEGVKQTLSAWQQVLNAVPTNPFEALAKGEMLQVVVLALLVGIGLTFIPTEKSAPVVRFFDTLADAMMHIVRLLMHLAPYAVFCLVAPVAALFGLDVFRGLGVYFITVLVGLAAMTYIAYPLILRYMIARKHAMSVREFFRAIAPAQLLAFSSSSSAATLPVTIECARDRVGVSEDVAGFVCPLGATINMDGTAVFQGVSIMFLAEVYGVPLSLADQIQVIIFATLISVGSPGIPGASIVLMIIVLESLRIPVEGIALIMGVERLLDMCRTVVNVTGDSMVATVVGASEGKLTKPVPGAVE